jgi:LysR family transcriptional regulator, nitrogen assimilation regulatory protein
MDLRQLGTFVHVAELGSFTRAAAVLRVAQPALSRQVRALEVELRQTLFERNGRGVTLTPAGSRLLAHGRGILQQVQRAVQELEELRGAATGLLSIGLPPTLSLTLTAPLVEAFRARFPRAGVSVVEGLTHYMLEWLVQGRLDCALVYNAVPSSTVALEPVLEEPLHLISARPAAGTSPRRARQPASVTLAELATCELVIPSRPHALRMRVETALAEAGLKPRIALEVESVGAMLALAQRHALHAVLAAPALQGTADRERLQARPIFITPQRPLSTSLSLATSAQRPRGPLLDQAAALLVQLAQAGRAARPA